MRIGFPRLMALTLALSGAVRSGAQLDLPMTRPPVVCFPPWVPVFGDEIADRPPPGEEAWRLRPPAELADYVADYFYPALSTRLIDKTVGGRTRARLDEYVAGRARLLNELADELLAVQGVDETTRAARLRALAERQSPAIVALEREAEELRRDLVNGGLLNRSANWSRDRQWTIGKTRFGNDVHAREAEFQVVRAAAYYQDELLPEQRGLLLEAAAELRRRARAARPVPGPRRDDANALFFSPATSRLRLPPKPSAELAGLVGRYNQLKVALTKELVQTVLYHDGTEWFERPAAFKALAERQWPQLAELEKMAEEIRVMLAALPPAKLTAPPYVPPALIARIDVYMVERRKLFDEFNETMRVAGELAERPRVYDWMTPEDRARVMREHETERSAVRAKVSAAFQEAAKERVQDLRTRYERIQEELKVIATGQVDPETGRPLDGEGLLRTYSAAIERFAIFGREEVIYRGYRTAMLMPGLSREQRRLLFNAAVVGLAQPLPFGETIPTGTLPVPRS